MPTGSPANLGRSQISVDVASHVDGRQPSSPLRALDGHMPRLRDGGGAGSSYTVRTAAPMERATGIGPS
jgi:hypothetical protein